MKRVKLRCNLTFDKLRTESKILPIFYKTENSSEEFDFRCLYSWTVEENKGNNSVDIAFEVPNLTVRYIHKYASTAAHRESKIYIFVQRPHAI